ncbi:RNA polymerase [Phyllobacterium sp. 21LDTY02-6]|uniref:NepR family anti-sigma factor n=1 Tax=unclassified Phyllobacterium TaxID=2638441 RepID=UPI0020212078|nr:NepR family anti-sigma factor [Phyllobacterium sp. 0TCS1.6A]MCO4317479.1 RNA polymerase [Phyllobacterium sp. 21LDTY02-6]MCX8293142.1 NepR family anti-sigma factor [Phyllobacterium sp. 0TCS1.6A]
MNPKNSSSDAPASAARIRRRDTKNAETEIGLKLRALYASVQDEEIPTRFLDLLEKLDEAERKHSQSSK